MAPSRDSNARPDTSKQDSGKKSFKKDIKSKAEQVLGNRKHANDVFDILEYLQADKEEAVVCAVNACNKMFCALLERGDLFIGPLPKEDRILTDNYSAEDKYKMWMRHRYASCVQQTLDLIAHEAFQVKESALCALMAFVEMEGRFPLVVVDWDEHYNFPRELLKSVVEKLLSVDEDMSLLISRFQEFLDFEDVRFYVMGFIIDNVAKVMDRKKEAVLPVYQNNVFTLLSNISVPSQEADLTNFMVKQEAKHEDWKAAKLKEHRRVFDRVWLGFLKYKLPSNMYKKVLVIFHDSILPHMSKPTLMIDFLTAAYDIGGAISLLALNGLFVLIHQHNLDYPDFYKKLYNLLEPSIFHVKYRARFFHLADLFLSSSHLPVYLVAAFAKRLSRLALTAPPPALRMLIPFICNLIRRHPSCRVLIHRPSAADVPREDPYIMEEEDPAQCHALESSLWELQALQKHYHPDVAKAASSINKTLPEQEDNISDLLEVSTYEMFEKELKSKWQSVPLEFEPAKGLLGRPGEILGQHFALE
ncbi:nucleolar complex protein 4 homolog [Amia ocellicauda]|uniref:nucleolar complex protein 4 homolog n=1 Tax=Amia ocellicauda TaxID=2972642 RepID=UPI0034643EB0